jgi:hypothetical protein
MLGFEKSNYGYDYDYGYGNTDRKKLEKQEVEKY